MGCRIVHDRDQDVANLYCSTSGVAFGPVFSNKGTHDADERVEAFLRWLSKTELWLTFQREPLDLGRRDPRQLTDSGLQSAYSAWLAQEATQWAEEEAEEAAKFAWLEQE